MIDRPRLLKRTCDVVLAAAAITLLSPLLAAIGLAVRLKCGCPVFYRQVRSGLHGKPFHMIKFRTMTNETDAYGNLLPDEERLTPFGHFLRSTSLDELPELLNVLRGEMSLVGPRPLLMEYLERYTPEQARRHEVRPGITGWAQINGRNAISWEERFKLDVWYVDNWSILLDIRVLLSTAWKVTTREGISADSHATMPEFEGRKAEDTSYS